MWTFHSKMSQEEKKRAGVELGKELAKHMNMQEADVFVDVTVQSDWTGTLSASLDVHLEGRARCDLEKVDEFFEIRLRAEIGVGAPYVRIGGVG